MAKKAAKMRLPEAYTGALCQGLASTSNVNLLHTGLMPAELTATIGAQRPATRLKNEAIPVPVPRFGAGKTSGVLRLCK